MSSDPSAESAARIAPLPPTEWPSEFLDALAVLFPANARHPVPRSEGRPKGLNALGTLARHVDLARAFNTLQGHLLFGTTLSVRQRELLILRVATRRDSPYEWSQHVLQAIDAGISHEEIAAIAADQSTHQWSTLEAALLAAADELVDDADVSDDTWSILADKLDVEQLMDVVFTIGAYEVVAMAFKSFRIQFDEDLPHL